MQLPLFPLQSAWRPTPVMDLPDWGDAKRVAIDCETRDPGLKELGISAGRRADSYIAGVSFAIEDGPSYYLPYRHEGGDNLPTNQVVGYLRDQCKKFKGDIVGAHLAYDIDFLASDDIVFKSNRFFRDVQIADPLINELHDRYSLEAIAQRWELPGKDRALLEAAAQSYGVHPGRDMWRLPARFVGAYGVQDVRLPLQILRKQERVIDDENLWKVYDLESRVLPLLVKMRRRGVRINMRRLEHIERWSLAEETEALRKVKDLCGITIAVGDVHRAEIMAAPLRFLGVPIGRTPTGKPKIDKDLFASIDHPIARALEWARKVNKLRTTFDESVREHLTSDGRIHCTFNQLRRQKNEEEGDEDTVGAAYGRLSCEHLNIQQQPSRDSFASMWRAIYEPEEGELWAAADYSQQEPRMAVHYASLSRHLIGHDAWLAACEARDRYRTDPKTDNHQMMADMIAGRKATSKERKDAKEIYLGLSYGMGGAELCRKLGLPTRLVIRGPRGVLLEAGSPEAKEYMAACNASQVKVFEAAGLEGQALIDKFNAKVPFILRLAKECDKRAKEVGYIVTLSGRRCRFPKDQYGNFDWTHKGLNRLIQGSSADQMKWAMVALDDAGFDIIIQVHDEVALSVENEQQANSAAQIMLDCCPLELPSKVDVEIGDSWGGSMGYREAA